MLYSPRHPFSTVNIFEILMYLLLCTSQLQFLCNTHRRPKENTDDDDEDNDGDDVNDDDDDNNKFILRTHNFILKVMSINICDSPLRAIFQN